MTGINYAIGDCMYLTVETIFQCFIRLNRYKALLHWVLIGLSLLWFGTRYTTVAANVTSPNNNAVFVSQTLPTTMTAGNNYTVSVTMQNIGTTTWTPGAAYRLGSQNLQDNMLWLKTTNRVNLQVSSVPPSDSVTFSFTVTAPSTAGSYNFQWRMVQDGVEWFGDSTPNVVVTVTGSTYSYNDLWGNTAVTNFFDPSRAIPVITHGCNTFAYAQVADMGSQLVGRRLQNAANDCSGSTWQLDLTNMNWNTNVISPVGSLFTPPISIEGGARTITTAYDPHIVKYNGELWVAFECHGINFSYTVSSCIGPLNLSSGLDPARTYAVILGNSYLNSDSYAYSGSVPKLVAHQGRLYLYWTAVKMLISNGAWQNITTRGIELEQESSGLRRLWPKGISHAVEANHPSSVEVLGLASDTLSNRAADTFDAQSDGVYIYITAGIGGDGCINPWSSSQGCYRLYISRTQRPLATNAFRDDPVDLSLLPTNPQEYSRFFIDSTGTLNVMGAFLVPSTPYGIVLPSGYQRFRIRPSKVGDINGDGSVNVVDFSIMLSKWGTSDPSSDLNGDGVVNIVDFSILLSKWGT